MPTSKDLLNTAGKTLNTYDIDRSSHDVSIKDTRKRIGQLTMAKAVLENNITATEHSLKVLAGSLAKLNAGLSELNKSAPVFKAPADAKVYAQLKAGYTEAIKTGMALSKDYQDLKRAIEAAVK